MNASQSPMKPTVLVVDDDEESILLVTTMVEYCGYVALRALNFEEAGAALAQHPAALVIDLIMPDADCERLIEGIIRAKSTIPIVLMSAAAPHALQERAESARERGANVVATLTKPFWIEPLISALEKAISEPAAIGGSEQG